MSGEIDDVVMSVRRVLATVLPYPWVMSLERDPVMDEDRPAVLIDAGEATISEYRRTVPQGGYTMTAPVTVTFYPSLPTTDGGAREAGRTARMLASILTRLFTEGPPGTAPDVPDVEGMGPTGFVTEMGRPASGPMMMPLWDWADVPLVGTAEERRGPVFPETVARIESASGNAIQDDQEARRWTVVVELRVSWRVLGRVAPEAPVVAQMPGTVSPD